MNFSRIKDLKSCFLTHPLMSHDYCHGADGHMIIKIHYGGRRLRGTFRDVYFGRYLKSVRDVSIKVAIIL